MLGQLGAAVMGAVGRATGRTSGPATTEQTPEADLRSLEIPRNSLVNWCRSTAAYFAIGVSSAGLSSGCASLRPEAPLPAVGDRTNTHGDLGILTNPRPSPAVEAARNKAHLQQMELWLEGASHDTLRTYVDHYHKQGQAYELRLMAGVLQRRRALSDDLGVVVERLFEKKDPFSDNIACRIISEHNRVAGLLDKAPGAVTAFGLRAPPGDVVSVASKVLEDQYDVLGVALIQGRRPEIAKELIALVKGRLPRNLESAANNVLRAAETTP